MHDREWIFAFIDYDGAPAVVVSEATEYEENESLDIGAELVDELAEILPDDLEEITSWVFSFEGSVRTCRKALVALGFCEDDRLAQHFVEA